MLQFAIAHAPWSISNFLKQSRSSAVQEDCTTNRGDRTLGLRGMIFPNTRPAWGGMSDQKMRADTAPVSRVRRKTCERLHEIVPSFVVYTSLFTLPRNPSSISQIDVHYNHHSRHPTITHSVNLRAPPPQQTQPPNPRPHPKSARLP